MFVTVSMTTSVKTLCMSHKIMMPMVMLTMADIDRYLMFYALSSMKGHIRVKQKVLLP